MMRPVRGAAFAVAAFAFAISAAWGDPLQAWQGESAFVANPWSAHGNADAAVSDLGLNDDAAPALAPAPAAPAPAEPRSLDAQVAELAGADAEGAEQDCLASAVYFEAQGEPLQGQLAVAEVVMNRAASGRYPASLCGVVRQPSQFSFVRRGRIPHANRASDAWHRAVAIARIAKAGVSRVLPANVLWYHANYVSPRWGRRLARTSQIGAHIFYR